MNINKAIMIVFGVLPAIAIASGETGKRGIENIHQRECINDKGFEVFLSAPHKNPDGCSNDRVVQFHCTNKSLPQITSIALAAMMADKQVWMWVNGCDAEGHAIGRTIRIHK